MKTRLFALIFFFITQYLCKLSNTTLAFNIAQRCVFLLEWTPVRTLLSNTSIRDGAKS